MPGEMITEESRPVLEFLQMLCEIGAHYPASKPISTAPIVRQTDVTPLKC